MKHLGLYVEGSRIRDIQTVESTKEHVVDLLKEKLESGLVVFFFEKKDKTIRKAIGTRNQLFIPKYQCKDVDKLVEESRDFLVGFGTGTLIKGDDEKLDNAIKPFLPKPVKEAKTPNPDVLPYYDIESKGFRSVNLNTLISIL